MSQPPVNLDRVWKSYRKHRDAESREKLLVSYLPLVKMVAGRMKIGLPGSVEYDDLVSAGLVGLINCIDSFNPELGFRFETYSAQRIRGAILDGLREGDWLSRSYRQKSRRLGHASEKLISRLGRRPSDEELAAELGFGDDDEEYYRFLDDAGAASMMSMDQNISTGESGPAGSLHDVIADERDANPHERMEQINKRDVILKSIDELNKQEKAIIALYYYEEMTFREIGEVIGVSESRVCQIHTRVISALRTRLGGVFG